jgi:hypothetical protein
MSESEPAFERGDCPCRLIPSRRGRHRFGGPPLHKGVIPKGTDVPLQLVLSLDLTDPSCPITNKFGIKTLPLYYPFKYGIGGSEIQYAVRSDSEIEVLYLSPSEPDSTDRQYLQVDHLPESSFELVPLAYEEARILAFLESEAFFPHRLRIRGHYEPSRADRKAIKKLDLEHLIRIGNQCSGIPNAPDPICRNPECERHESLAYFQAIATVPPIPVNGEDDFWYQFRGGDVRFSFGLCYFCGTIISFNVAG